MNKALFAAASGMAAQQQNLDVIANNLANADVVAFKGAAASFEEIGAPGQTGLGTAPLGTHLLFDQGKLSKSGGPFDLAIDGEGFFSVVDRHGNHAYTRDGQFARSQDGSLRNVAGWRLEGVRIPSDALSAEVGEDGTVTVRTAQGTQTCGKIRLAEFASPERLAHIGGTLFAQTTASGHARFITAGSPNGPKIAFGMLEQSNVSIVEAMMQILAAQRAYEANAKGVQAADEMMRIADNLQRS